MDNRKYARAIKVIAMIIVIGWPIPLSSEEGPQTQATGLAGGQGGAEQRLMCQPEVTSQPG